MHGKLLALRGLSEWSYYMLSNSSQEVSQLLLNHVPQDPKNGTEVPASFCVLASWFLNKPSVFLQMRNP